MLPIISLFRKLCIAIQKTNKMKIRYLLLILLAVTLFNFRNPSTQAYYAPHDDGKYDKLWEKVDSLEDEGLPQSALEIVEQIYDLAKEDGNSDQLLKSVV